MQCLKICWLIPHPMFGSEFMLTGPIGTLTCQRWRPTRGQWGGWRNRHLALSPCDPPGPSRPTYCHCSSAGCTSRHAPPDPVQQQHKREHTGSDSDEKKQEKDGVSFTLLCDLCRYLRKKTDPVKKCRHGADDAVREMGGFHFLFFLWPVWMCELGRKTTSPCATPKENTETLQMICNERAEVSFS